MNTKTTAEIFFDLLRSSPQIGSRMELETWEKTLIIPSTEPDYLYMQETPFTRFKIQLFEKRK